MNMTSRPTSPTPAPTVYLVALDATEDATHVLDVACGLGAALGGAAELHIVHIVPGPSTNDVLGMSALGAPVDYMKGGELLLERTAAHAAQQFRGKIAGHLAAGQPWREIVQIASDIGVDLLIVGTAGRTGLARFALGSVAEQVVRHAGCPVLVVRPKDHVVPAEAAATGVRIEPPCRDCVEVRARTERASLWCERHRAHHPHGHLHYEYPPTYAVGSMNFRP